MKKLLTLIYALVIGVAGKGQYVEKVESHAGKLKKTTTVFFVRTEKEDSLATIEKILDSAWNFTEIIVASISDREAYMDEEVEEYSFFELGGLFKMDDVSRNIYVSLDLNIYPDNKKVTVGTINLFPSPVFLWDVVRAYNSGELDKINLYKYEGDYYNWNWGVIKNYLQVMSYCLENGKKGKPINKSEAPNIKNDTLYMPEYILYRHNKFTGNIKKPFKAEELLEEYKFPYKILTAKELSNKILTSEVPFYYLDYNKRGTDNMFWIRNSKTGYTVYLYQFDSDVKPKVFKKMHKELEAADGSPDN